MDERVEKFEIGSAEHWAMFEQAMRLYPDRPEHHEGKAEAKRNSQYIIGDFA